MFDQLTARAISKVGQLQRELDEAKAAIAELVRLHDAKANLLPEFWDHRADSAAWAAARKVLG